jgi:hypothetical protein
VRVEPLQPLDNVASKLGELRDPFARFGIVVERRIDEIVQMILLIC